MRNVLALCDAAIVVCEADPRKVAALQVILRELEEMEIPRMIFLNKIDANPTSVRERSKCCSPPRAQTCCSGKFRFLKTNIATGFIDLALERAFVYREHAPSTVIDLPADEQAREKEARYLHAGTTRRLRRRVAGGTRRRHRAAARPNFR